MNVIVYGPQGCGKTRNAERLARFFGCTQVVDIDKLGDLKAAGKVDGIGLFLKIDDDPRKQDLQFKTLYLTHPERLFDDMRVIGDARVISFDEAMRLINEPVQIPSFLRRRAGSFGGES